MNVQDRKKRYWTAEELKKYFGLDNFSVPKDNEEYSDLKERLKILGFEFYDINGYTQTEDGLQITGIYIDPVL